MLTIRLTRKGKKNQPFFRVVVIDKRSSTRGGRSVEDLGYVDPLKKRRSFNAERIKYWLSKGAQASATMHNLLVSEKIIEGEKIHVSNLSKKAKEKIKVAAEAKVAEAEATKAKAQKEAEDKIAAEKAEAEKSAEPVAETPVEEAKPEEVASETAPETPAE
ncbi:MAG: 30S ribosomal protein S16 [Candidatus Staskawiczbacteria bacterium]|jgi:small subunit ribosomal protein S16